MPFRTIEVSDLAHLRWKQEFNSALIVAYHFEEHDKNEMVHDHDFMEIQLCAGGSGGQQTPLGELSFTRGQALLIRPGGWHRHHDNEHMDAYVCCFDANLLMHELLWTLDDPRLNQLLWRPSTGVDVGISHLKLEEPVLQRCISAFDQLVALGEVDDPEQKPLRLGYLTVILALLAGSMPDIAQQPAQPVHSAVRRCLAIMEERLDEPWTAQSIAKMLNINVSYLGRLFKNTLGTSPMAFLTHMRLERAARLLSRTDKLISEIGVEVGWPDPNYFARRFRSYFGVSASAYRERRTRHQAEVQKDPNAAFSWVPPLKQQ